MKDFLSLGELVFSFAIKRKVSQSEDQRQKIHENADVKDIFPNLVEIHAFAGDHHRKMEIPHD
jgi:hypothetical protein